MSAVLRQSFGALPLFSPQCEQALDQLLLASSKNSSCIIVGLPKRIGGQVMDVIAVIQNGELLALLPACGSGMLSSADPLLGYWENCPQEKLFGWDTLFCCGDLRFCICPCPVQELPLHLPRLAKTGCHAGAGAQLPAGYRRNQSASAASGAGSFGKALASPLSWCAAVRGTPTRIPMLTKGTPSSANAVSCSPIAPAGHRPEKISMRWKASALPETSDCDILNACRRFASRTPANILLTENDGKKGLMRTVSADPFLPDSEQEASDYLDRLFDLQVQGLVARVANTGLHRLVLGVSGGLDSTLALLVCHQALKELDLPANNLIAITMPGFGTTDRTYYNALSLISALGADNRDISIKASVLQHFEDIGHDPSVRDVTYENAQARERTQILMDVANSCRGLVVGTGDMSEDALGWCTFGGDHLAKLADVNVCLTKTMIRSDGHPPVFPLR